MKPKVNTKKVEESVSLIQIDEDLDGTVTDKILNKLINLRDKFSDTPLIQKISVDYILNTIEKEHFSPLQNAFNLNGKRGVTVIEFIKIFLELNHFKQEENLFYVMGLVDLYQQIQQNMREERNIIFSDFTDFHYEYFQEKEVTTYKIPTYLMPPQRIVDGDFKNQREIDIDPPIIVGKHNKGVLRLNPETLKFDSLKHRADNNIKGYYAKDIRQVITLDSLSGQLNLYDTDAQLTQVLKPTNFSQELATIIIAFAYSSFEQRIGACLKDCSLAFWESNDNFSFSKQFSTVAFMDDFSTDIWYLEQQRKWITTNQQNKIYLWNLVEEKIEDIIPTSKHIKGTILKILEISHIRQVAIASSDKQITIWNFYTKLMVLTIPVKESGINQLIYSYNYQIILTAGFEQIIYLFSVNAKHLEYKQEGRLIGHTSMVTAIQDIANTQLVVSADDQGIVKVWDIRTLGCLQTIKLYIKSSINSIQYIHDKNSLCILSSRVGFINFDLNSNFEGENDKDKTNQNYPINVDFDPKNQQIVVCTSKDLRIYNGDNGRIKKLVKGISNDQGEITFFNFVNQLSQIVVCDDKGTSLLIEYANTNNQYKLNGHQGEITQMKIDYKNKQIVTSGKDSQIIIQKIMRNGTNELKRTFKNAHFGKGINFMDFSYYHNIIITASDTNEIFIYDYEYLKCIGTILLPNDSTPSYLHFINGYSILVVTTMDGFVYMLHINLSDSYLDFKLLSVIDLLAPRRNTSDYFQSIINQSNQNRSYFDYGFQQMNLKDSNYSQTPLGLKSSPNRYSQKSFKPQYPSILQSLELNISKSSRNSIQYNEKDEQEPLNYAIKVVANNKTENHLDLYIGRIDGSIEMYDISKVIADNNITIRTSYEQEKKNFNPGRITNEVFTQFSEKAEQNRFLMSSQLLISEMSLKSFLSQSSAQMTKVKSVQAHKNQLHSIKIVSLNRYNYLSSCSNDGYFKIWDLELNQQTNTNVNHPLPMSWDLKLSTMNEIQRRFYFTIKILDLMCKKYEKEPIFQRLLSTQLYLQQIIQTSINNTQNNQESPNLLLITQPTMDSKSNIKKLNRRKNSRSLDLNNIDDNKKVQLPPSRILTMKSFYTPKDMQYQQVRDQFINQLKGPTLKEMDFMKRMNELKTKDEKLEKEQIEKSDNNDVEIEKKMRENEDRENIFFLLPQYKDKVLKRNKEVEFHEPSDLQKKLEAQQYYLERQLQKQNSVPQNRLLSKISIDDQTSTIQIQGSIKQKSSKEIGSLTEVKNSSTNIQNESSFQINPKQQSIANSYYHSSYNIQPSVQNNILKKNNQQMSLPILSTFNTSQNAPQSQFQSQQQSSQLSQMNLTTTFQKQMYQSHFQNKSQGRSTYTTNPKRGLANCTSRALTDFFQYAQQKQLYSESSSRYQSQLNELSTNINLKKPILDDLSMSLKEENFLDGSTQIDLNQASKLSMQKNKQQLLKRMEERNKMNDIMKNLNSKLVSSKYFSQNKLNSKNIHPQTSQNHLSQTVKFNFNGSRESASSFQFPSQNSSEIYQAAQSNNIDQFKVEYNIPINLKRTNNKVFRKKEIQSLSQNPSQIISQQNLSQQ